MFFGLVSGVFFTIYSKRYLKNIRDRSKNRDPANIIGERSAPPLSVELSEFPLYLYIYIYIFQAVRRARTVNALCANVGPVG